MKNYLQKLRMVLLLINILAGATIAHAANWTVMGSAGFSTGEVDYTHTAIDTATGSVYMGFCDRGEGYKARVFTYDGSSWTQVGADVSPGAISGLSLTVDKDGTPYVAYID